MPVGLQSDQVYAVDRRVLDPHRPFDQPTQQQMEQGLLPYEAHIGINPLNIITYNKTVRHFSFGHLFYFLVCDVT